VTSEPLSQWEIFTSTANSTPLRETPEWQRGEEFQTGLARYLQARGWGTVPVYDYDGGNNKAPKLDRRHGSLILPDLFAARAGVSVWCEAKRKTSATLTMITGQHETGIDARLYDHYRQVKNESGLRVFLFFGHDVENEVRHCEVDEFTPRFSPNFNRGRGGYFWPWAALHLLCPLTDVCGLIGEENDDITST
jgi:hypothetical protein